MNKVCLSIFFLLGSLSAGSTEPPRSKLQIINRTSIQTGAAAKVEAQPSSSIKMVRIGVRQATKKASLQCNGSFWVIATQPATKKEWPAGKYFVTSRGGQIFFDGKKIGSRVTFQPTSAANPVGSNETYYRGTLTALARDGSVLNLINELSVDDYLKGVLPREVVVSWPEECLKVQAVASRSYLRTHLNRHSKDGFDLCSDVHCQVYGGMSRENTRTSKAVDGTQGEILIYKGKPVSTFFHSNCGGQTEKIKPVWGSTNKPYLPAKRCKFGTKDPRYKWSLTMKKADALKKLKNKDLVKGTSLKSVSVAKKSESGRAEALVVKTNKGSYKMSGNAFRLALHPEKVRSTLWTRFSDAGGSLRFEGRGWGHGVGMCQWGAKGQAEKNKKYKDILTYYYPQTSLGVWTN